MDRFAGKTVLVTGATSGIGRAGAERLTAEGARVVLTGTRDDRLADLCAALPAAVVVRDDAGDPETGRALAAVVADVGPLDGLWLNAGYAEVGRIEDVTADAFDRMMAVNVRGPLLQLAALAPHLADGASVVVTSSTSADEGAAATSLYAATKGAVVAAVRTWAAELGPRGIRANTLVPGPIETDFRHFMADDQRDAFESAVLGGVPLGRVGTSAEAAAVALFLLSDDASYVTGGQYAVDGGLTRA